MTKTPILDDLNRKRNYFIIYFIFFIFCVYLLRRTNTLFCFFFIFFMFHNFFNFVVFKRLFIIFFFWFLTRFLVYYSGVNVFVVFTSFISIYYSLFFSLFLVWINSIDLSSFYPFTSLFVFLFEKFLLHFRYCFNVLGSFFFGGGGKNKFSHVFESIKKKNI